MLGADIHRERRQRLLALIDGPILLMGNGTRARNLPMNHLPFRQDSTFLYFMGYRGPDAMALLHDGQTQLFVPIPDEDDVLWHGPSPSAAELAGRYGVDRVRDLSELDACLRGLRPKTLAVADEAVNRRAEGWAGPLAYGRHHGHPDLVSAVIAMRRCKDQHELEAMREAARISTLAHLATMRATRPGESEHRLAVLFSSVLAIHGAVPGYAPILTCRGEVLHNHDHSGILQEGQLLLLDGGGEVSSGYGVDITRTWPVSGRFSSRQRAAYEAVLEAQQASIGMCRAGVHYREVHDASSRVLARFLVDEGLLTCSVDEALETGAHALFFPHGVGHHLGLDVHDLENFGDLPSYPPNTPRPSQFGTCNLRLNLPLEAQWVVTIEPGLYVVPAILGRASLRDLHRGQVDFERAESWMGFGGIRIEDDILVTAAEPEVLTAATPSDPDEIEELVATAPPILERLC